MKRVRLTVAYDGTDFSGFQFQPGKRTVESELIGALNALYGHSTEITGASRTDSGVHALGNVVVFDTGSSLPPERTAAALKAFLPCDIKAVASDEVPCGWHPRKQASVKTYDYYIFNSDRENPLLSRYSSFSSYRLDTGLMNKAASFLTGTHDFLSFANPASQVLINGGDAVRTVYSLDVSRPGGSCGDGTSFLDGLIRIRISGSGFLYNMVRIIAGTLLEAGRGRWTPEYIKDILDARDRRAAGPTMEAKGLVLREIRFI